MIDPYILAKLIMIVKTYRDKKWGKYPVDDVIDYLERMSLKQ